MSHTFTVVVSTPSQNAPKFVPVTIAKNCIKSAVDTVLAVDPTAKPYHGLEFYVGKNLHKIEEKTRWQCVAEAYAKTFA